MTWAMGGLTRDATMAGWFVMWTVEGTRLVHATSGPFDTEKGAQSYAGEMAEIMKKASGDSGEGTYYLLKGGGSK